MFYTEYMSALRAGMKSSYLGSGSFTTLTTNCPLSQKCDIPDTAAGGIHVGRGHGNHMA